MITTLAGSIVWGIICGQVLFRDNPVLMIIAAGGGGFVIGSIARSIGAM